MERMNNQTGWIDIWWRRSVDAAEARKAV